jgi:hypothetical protein
LLQVLYDTDTGKPLQELFLEALKPDMLGLSKATLWWISTLGSKPLVISFFFDPAVAVAEAAAAASQESIGWNHIFICPRPASLFVGTSIF